MSRIDAAFARCRAEKRAALIVFVTAGDPDLQTTAELLPELAAAGADLIELGFPHSDPIGEGPTIQASSQRALRRHTTLAQIFELVRRVRTVSEVPLVLMGYLNNVLAHGEEQFAKDCAAAGVDGLILPDSPQEETEGLSRACDEHGVQRVLLVAPTSTPLRVVRIAARSRGFVYCVSVTGVTGARTELPADLAHLVGPDPQGHFDTGLRRLRRRHSRAGRGGGPARGRRDRRQRTRVADRRRTGPRRGGPQRARLRRGARGRSAERAQVVRSMRAALIVVCSVVSCGCVAVFRHETLPATITITEQATGLPVANAAVSVGYSYDGYQYIYVYNRPENAEATTDANGRATLPVADFEYGTFFHAAYALVTLTPEQVRAGGSFAMLNGGTLYRDKPILVLSLERPAR